ncbi:MAG: methyltransferase [Myxococcales bacterium]|nr:methyltransferase [Myxococcales bacterium]
MTLAGATRPAAIGDPEPWTVGADGRPLRLGPGGFGQANERVNVLLGACVAEIARACAAAKAVELYAGAGNLSVVLAPLAGELTTVESRRESCDAARANLAARGLRAKVIEGDAETHAWSPATDLAVLDPPRTGARALAARLASSRVPHVLYVSCDPPTLGRDLAILAPAYEVRSVSTFEMFPQTSHVETVVMLARRRGAAAGRCAEPSRGS